jgi:hypothetical protein
VAPDPVLAFLEGLSPALATAPSRIEHTIGIQDWDARM